MLQKKYTSAARKNLIDERRQLIDKPHERERNHVAGDLKTG